MPASRSAPPWRRHLASKNTAARISVRARLRNSPNSSLPLEEKRQRAAALQKLTTLEFRSAEHQSCDHSHVHALYRIIQPSLHNLRIFELLLQSFDRASGCFSTEEEFNR